MIGKDNDFKKTTILSSFDKKMTLLQWLKRIEKKIDNFAEIDKELSPTSTHAVENRAIYQGIEDARPYPISDEEIENLFR